MTKRKYESYADYVIRDGRLVGEFEEMYRDFDDPWHQAKREEFASEKAVVLNLLARLKKDFGVKKVVELGSGLGHFTKRIARLGLDVTGVDISETAVAKATKNYPEIRFLNSKFSDFERLLSLTPEVIVMAEVTWYLLDDLSGFISFMREKMADTFLLHSLVTYPPGAQKYGTEFFTDLDGILRFFGMRYLESGEIRVPVGGRRTYFLGSWSADIEAKWLAER